MSLVNLLERIHNNRSDDPILYTLIAMWVMRVGVTAERDIDSWIVERYMHLHLMDQVDKSDVTFSTKLFFSSIHTHSIVIVNIYRSR